MTQRVSKLDASRLLGVSPTTIDRRMSRVNHNCRFGVNQFCRFTSSAWPRCWAASVR